MILDIQRVNHCLFIEIFDMLSYFMSSGDQTTEVLFLLLFGLASGFGSLNMESMMAAGSPSDGGVGLSRNSGPSPPDAAFERSGCSTAFFLGLPRLGLGS